MIEPFETDNRDLIKEHYREMLMLFFDMEYFGEPWATETWKHKQVNELLEFLDRKKLFKESVWITRESK